MCGLHKRQWRWIIHISIFEREQSTKYQHVINYYLRVYTLRSTSICPLVFNRTIEEFEFEKKNRIRKASLSILKWNVPHSVVDYYLDFKVNTKICYFVLLFSPNWPRSLATFYSINVYSMRRIVCLCALYCNRHRFKPDHKSQ